MQGADLGYLNEILILLLAAVCVVPFFRHFRASPVLGYLAAGVLLGPYALAAISSRETVLLLAELGVVFLLFTIGLELSIARFKALKRYVFGLGSLQVLVTGLLIGVVALGFGMSPAAAVVIGGGLALSSTAFVAQLLADKGEIASRFGQVSVAILLLQDLAIVPLLALVPLLAQPDGSLWSALFMALLKAGGAVSVTLLFGRFVLRPLYRYIAQLHSPEIFVATTLLVLLGTASLTHFAGASMALGAFLAGLLLSGTEYRHQVEADMRPFKGLLLGLFFMSIGLAMDLEAIAAQWPIVLVTVPLLMVAKALIIFGLCRLFGLPADLSARVGLILSQCGEFAFILIGGAMLLGVIDPADGQTLLAVVVITMILTPFLDTLGSRIAPYLSGKATSGPLPSLADEIGEMSGHVVIAGFGRVGQTVAQVLSSAQVPYIAFDLNPAHVRDCRRRDLSVHYGDASRVDVLQAAGLDRAVAAVITLDGTMSANHAVAALRAHNSELPIFVRARDLAHHEELTAVGASAVVPETIEASLQIGGVVLRQLGFGTAEVERVMDACRNDDYASLERLSGGDRQSSRE